MKPNPRIEWLETNGLGGYAFGTSAGYPTRRYHGLLISARKPPVDRRMLFAGLQASMHERGKWIDLDPRPGAPDGGRLIDFIKDPFPQSTYRTGSGRADRLVRTVFMRHARNTTVVSYRLSEGAADVRVRIRIVPAMRDHNDICGEPVKGAVNGPSGAGMVNFSRGQDRAYLHHSRGTYENDPAQIGPTVYEWETRQGMADREYFFSPGAIAAVLRAGETLHVTLSDRPIRSARPEAWRRVERARRRRIAAGDRGMILPLSNAADQFIVTRTGGAPGRPKKLRTIVAGYPWFTDWGRDTMISLEGLTLARGELGAAREILAAFAGAESDGMIPNHYPEADAEPQFNTVDASLLFFEAGQKFLTYGGAESFARRTLFPVFESIIRNHMNGVRFNIRADDSTGFLFSGERGTQLTWMDAKVDDWVVTPRHGFPVEIQALWYNALKIFAALSLRFGRAREPARRAASMADLCKRSFHAKFWNEDGGCLYDCLAPDGNPVADVRPNQLMALSLTHPIVDDRARGRRILRAVRSRLLTPAGLRTIAPGHPDYKGRHEGDRLSRDAAYHQGTVWPWLIGPYARAYQAVEGRTAKTRAHFRKILRGFRRHLNDCALGTVSEIMDGDAPHEPKGCVAQAWSVAELNVLNRMARR